MHYKYIHNFLMYENFFKNLETKKNTSKIEVLPMKNI